MESQSGDATGIKTNGFPSGDIEKKIKNMNINSSEKESSQNLYEEMDGKPKGEAMSFGQGSNSFVLPPDYSLAATPIDAVNYNMNHKHRGHCIIFNQSVFEDITGLGARNGSDRDRDNVASLFRSLEYSVVIYNNLSVKGIKQYLEKYSCEVDHSDCDSLVIVFMSHGEDGNLFGRDGIFKSEDLYCHFTADNCPSLAGKPKMFFIQACRGAGLDPGRKMLTRTADQTDSGSCYMYKIPNHADFLICWSTVAGHYSWRNTTNGSWFIQSLVEIFGRYANTLDVLSMTTYVNRHMIITFESNCPSTPEMDRMKQSASFVSTLMRCVYLKPKK